MKEKLPGLIGNDDSPTDQHTNQPNLQTDRRGKREVTPSIIYTNLSGSSEEQLGAAVAAAQAEEGQEEDRGAGEGRAQGGAGVGGAGGIG